MDTISSKPKKREAVKRVQLDMGDKLLEEEQYLMELNIGIVAIGTGTCQEYLLMAVKAAWMAKLLLIPPDETGRG